MRTPGHDHELALGFLYTEGIIDSYQQIAAVESIGEIEAVSGYKNIVRVEIDAAIDLQLERLERHFYTTSSCGVCGKASLDALRVTGLKVAGRTRNVVSQTNLDRNARPSPYTTTAI